MTSLAMLAGPSGWETVADALRVWLPRQRWFASKHRIISRVAIGDATLLRGPDLDVLDALVDVSFTDGVTERYQVPLVGSEPEETPDEAIVAGIDGTSLADAMRVEAAATLLATATLSPTEHRSERGATVVGVPVDGQPQPRLAAPRPLGAEQSNTSVVFGEERILKLFRKVETGLNPDVELTGALTKAGFVHVPAQHGSLQLAEDDRRTALAVLSDFVAGGRDGWALATADARSPESATLSEELLGSLGACVAAMHAALRDAFGGRPAERHDLETWVAGMRGQAEQVLATAERLEPETCRPVLARRDEILARFGDVLAVRATGPTVRIHGDLHLGQVLLDPSSRWQILDFEGEPARSLEERRARSAPLRDAAGMLRSFDYAAAVASGPPAERWRDRSRGIFLDGYLPVADDAGLLPTTADAVAAQIAAFELDKAVYELGYELANRPGWAAIPVGGITRVLDGPAKG